ncbi:MAG: stalk domain-containing protein [Clostridiales bacterium]|nr:stalk domain-containing protein [Clostridiales bacterium]
MKLSNLRRIFCGFIAGAVVAAIVPVIAKTVEEQITVYYKDIKINIDGEPLDTTGAEPFIYDGTTYLPVRKISEAVGKNVQWDGTTNTVSLGSAPGTTNNLFDIMQPHASNYCKIYSGNDKYNFLGAERKNCAKFDDVSPYLTFNFDGKYKELTFETGMNNYGGVLEIYADDVLVQEVQTPGNQPPKKVTVPLDGVLQLTIIPTGNFYVCCCWDMQLR